MITFEGLSARHQETICMVVGGIKAVQIGALVPGFLLKGNMFVVDNLLDGIGHSSRSGLVTSYVVTGKKRTIAGG